MGKRKKPSSLRKNRLYPKCDTTIWLRSCQKEVLEPVAGLQTGVVPKWLCGSLLRNGPGNLKIGDMEFEHLFDCSALLHRFNIKNGQVTYQNRFLQSETLRKNLSANRIVVTEFGTKAVPDPCQTIFQRIAAVFDPSGNLSDNAMISIYPFGDEYFAMTENPIMYQINPQTLSTEKRVNLREKIGIINHTSHPHVMPNGTVFNLGMILHKTGPKYCIVQFNKNGENNMLDNSKVIATIPCRWRFYPSYMHTFGITENYFVIVEQPLSISLVKAVRNSFFKLPLAETLQWDQNEPTIMYLVSRKTGQIECQFKTKAFFFLHIINQYEENDNVVIDISCYNDPSMINCMYIDALKDAQKNPDYAKMFRGRPMRFILPKSDQNHFIEPELLCTLGCETPRIHYNKYCGRKYRYFYAISSDVDSENPGNIIKVDTQEGTKKIWGEPNIYPSEPVFVANPDGTEEDDGIILSAIIWGGDKTNDTGLLILDAKTWTEISRTIFKLDTPVPKCLHGWFVPH